MIPQAKIILHTCIVCKSPPARSTEQAETNLAPLLGSVHKQLLFAGQDISVLGQGDGSARSTKEPPPALSAAVVMRRKLTIMKMDGDVEL
jgi:hypothetical protein